jgi:PAS domain-containing protein
VAWVVAARTEVEDAIPADAAPDQFALARIKRERAEAMARLEEDRDVTAWKAAVERLDAEEATAAAAAGRVPLRPSEVAAILADVETMFMDCRPATQHRILLAAFEEMEVLGPNEVWLYPSVESEMRGWAAAMSGEFRIERKTGRGERDSPSLTHRPSGHDAARGAARAVRVAPQRMTRRPSRPAERATDREVGVVVAVLVTGSEKAAAHCLGLSHSTVKHPG